MAELSGYAAFVAVAEQGSLTTAARHLGRSLQSVSRSLIALETELGVSLIRRTTRSSRPTEVGLAFLARVRPALAELAAAGAEIGEEAERVEGLVRIGGPALFGAAYLTPLVAAFMRGHPAIAVELHLGEGYADLLAERFDLAIRLGPLPDSRLKARGLGSLRQVAFAAPSYLAEHGAPRHPADLVDHRCIVRTSARQPARWTFGRDGRSATVSVSGPFRAGNPAACNEAAAQGLGIGRAPLWQVRNLLDAGRLALVLTDYALDSMPIHLVWPNGRLAKRTRLLIDHIVARLDLRLL